MGKQEVLDHAPTIKGFVTKLPSKAIGERYVAMTKELKAKGETDLSIINTFMKAERQNQKQMEELFGSKGSSKGPREPLGRRKRKSGRAMAGVPANKRTGPLSMKTPSRMSVTVTSTTRWSSIKILSTSSWKLMLSHIWALR